MRYEYFKIFGYKGIYAGMQLTSLEVDLSKSKHRVIAIKGDNGCGKSTLKNALNLMPDSSEYYMENMTAGKEFIVRNNDELYHILIISKVKSNGKREPTKAYISKIVNNISNELNENGNISSYKDILFSTFNLDPSFISLTQLSGDNEGIIYKTPGARKSYMSSILTNLQVYNNILKVLSKKSSIFKNMINSIVSKIDMIGDINKLNMSLSSIEQTIISYEKRQKELGELIAVNKSKVELLDPNSSIQTSYNDIKQTMIQLKNDINSNNISIRTKLKRLNIEEINEEELIRKYNTVEKTINEITMTIKINESKINQFLQSREDQSKHLQDKLSKVQSLKNDETYSYLKKNIKETKEKIEYYKTIISKIGIKDNSITKDEFILAVNSLKEIKEIINIFRSSTSYSILERSINFIRNNTVPNIIKIDKELEEDNKLLSDYTKEYTEMSVNKEMIDKLKNRPSECKIDNCYFIKSSLDLSKQFDKNRYMNLDKYIKELNIQIEKLNKEKKDFNECIETINYLKTIIRSISSNIKILSKLSIIDINKYSNTDELLTAIENNYSFDEIDYLYKYIESANIIDEYKILLRKMESLNNDYQLYEAKAGIIDDAMKEIEELDKELDDMSIKIKDLSQVISKDKITLSNLQSISIEYESLIDLFKKKDNLNNKLEEVNRKYSIIKENMKSIEESINIVNLNQLELNEVTNKIIPIKRDRDRIKHSIEMTKDYNSELDLYTAKFKKVNTIKKYCSPSGDGIQLIFISMYMQNIIDMCNQLLALLFNGEYKLLPFEINEYEFKIPVTGRIIPCDDVSSMSRSQRNMIQMILSAVLLYNSSTVYNILALDEVDGGLDTRNRLIFFDVLDKMCDILSIEQVFLISHNDELDLSSCDIILLKSYPEILNNIDMSNVIYNYEDQMKGE